MADLARLSEAFHMAYGCLPAYLASAPGRVNLIGEHTDYNDGFVLPMAIDRSVCIAAGPRPDGEVVLRSLDGLEPVTFSIGDEGPGAGWSMYPRGMAWALGGTGLILRGWQGVIASTVPIGAGLSSSAALEMALARAFCWAAAVAWDARAMALAGHRAENERVGVHSGIMDQLIVAEGLSGHALLIDCRSLRTCPIPIPAGATIFVLDTGTRRKLSISAYNDRRSECQSAAVALGVQSLRDVSLQQFDARAGRLAPVLFRRARHVVSENDRTLAAAEAMRRSDAPELGRLMNASHDSLRDDFQVTSVELDIMAECARESPGCLGARMTGAGFGGCCMALVRDAEAAAFARQVSEAYHRRTGVAPKVYQVRSAGGAAGEPWPAAS